MPNFEREIDASFYNLIHQLGGSQPPAGVDERRQQRRQPFRVVQRIAIGRGSEVPAESEFFEVQCHDLTRGGFSFLVPERPAFDRFVAAFGVMPEVIYTATRGARCQDVQVDADGRVRESEEISADDDAGFDERTARPMVLVGCRLIERLNP